MSDLAHPLPLAPDTASAAPPPTPQDDHDDQDQPVDWIHDARVQVLVHQSAHDVLVRVLALVDRDVDEVHLQVERAASLIDGPTKDVVSMHLHQILALYISLRSRLAAV